MKINFLYDIFLGLLILTIILNFIYEYPQKIYNCLPKAFQLSTLCCGIILLPIITDMIFSGFGEKPNSFLTSILSAAITLTVRETFAWHQERTTIKEEMFSELDKNYRELSKWWEGIKLYLSISSQSTQFNISFFEDENEANKIIWSIWSDKTYNNHISKIRAKKIYDVNIIQDIDNIYRDIERISIKNSKKDLPDHNNLEFIRVELEELKYDYGVLPRIKKTLEKMKI